MARDGVHWTWSPASAQVLRARGVEPTLVVREGRQLVWSAPLKGTSGIVPLPRRPGPQATIEVVGFAKDWEVRSIQGQPKALFSGARATNAPRPELCVGFVRDSEACLAAITRLPGDAVQVIQACDDAFMVDEQELACVTALERVVADPVQVVKACDSAMTSADAALACIAVAESGPVVEHCDKAFMSDEAEVECIRNAPSAAAVDACDAAFTTETSELDCLRALSATLGDRPDGVRACAESAGSDDDELACIRAVGSSRRR